ncbi:MAG TPA: LysR substrate-binding domain-containing protein [Dongiaceae bacterium]|nr:LysR substrate-binding domain-containing protein [Dongiaceae bacterium]
MDRFESMSVLVAVAEAGSLSAASRRLRIPVTTVSRKISDLEAQLKVRLLNRSTRKLSLSDAGRYYVEAARRIIEQVEEVERATTGEYTTPRGRLTITAPVSLGRIHVVPTIIEFRKAFPEIDVRLILSDGILNHLDNDIDLAVRIGNLPASSLHATRIGSTRRIVCGSPGYFAARGRPKKPSDLAMHDCITFENMSSPAAWGFRFGKKEKAIRLHSWLSVTSAEAAIEAAIAGGGVTRMLSYKIEAARRAGALDLVLAPYELAPWPISIIFPGQGLLPLKVRAFLNWATPRLKAALRSGDLGG